jgi:hypothetical protein
MRRVSAEEEREKLEHYLFEMDDVLEDFVGEARALGYALDYREDSLVALEAFIAERLESDPSQVKNRAARYLGEVFRKNVGGRWDIYLENPKDLHYKLPVVTGFSSVDFDFCPIELVENFVVKKEAGTLSRAFRYHKQYADKT